MNEPSVLPYTAGVIEHTNPDTLPKNPAFTQVVTVTGPVKTIYVGGQNAVNVAGEIVGRRDIRRQMEQVLSNLQAALAAGGVSLEYIVKWNVYVVHGQPLQPAFEVFQRVWGSRANPPAITVVYIAGLAHPDFLVEMDAVAVVPLSSGTKL